MTLSLYPEKHGNTIFWLSRHQHVIGTTPTWIRMSLLGCERAIEWTFLFCSGLQDEHLDWSSKIRTFSILTTENHSQPATIPNLDHSAFLKFHALYWISFSRNGRQSAHSPHQTWLLHLILRRKCDPFAVSLSQLIGICIQETILTAIFRVVRYRSYCLYNTGADDTTTKN